MILLFINIRKVPQGGMKTSGFALGFQHFPRDLPNVNEWKIMFDPSIMLHPVVCLHTNVALLYYTVYYLYVYTFPVEIIEL